MHACVYKCVGKHMGMRVFVCVHEHMHTQGGFGVDTKLPVSLLGNNAPLDRTKARRLLAISNKKAGPSTKNFPPITKTKLTGLHMSSAPYMFYNSYLCYTDAVSEFKGHPSQVWSVIYLKVKLKVKGKEKRLIQCTTWKRSRKFP